MGRLNQDYPMGKANFCEIEECVLLTTVAQPYQVDRRARSD